MVWPCSRFTPFYGNVGRLAYLNFARDYLKGVGVLLCSGFAGAFADVFVGAFVSAFVSISPTMSEFRTRATLRQRDVLIGRAGLADNR